MSHISASRLLYYTWCKWLRSSSVLSDLMSQNLSKISFSRLLQYFLVSSFSRRILTAISAHLPKIQTNKQTIKVKRSSLWLMVCLQLYGSQQVTILLFWQIKKENLKWRHTYTVPAAVPRIPSRRLFSSLISSESLLTERIWWYSRFYKVNTSFCFALGWKSPSQ